MLKKARRLMTVIGTLLMATLVAPVHAHELGKGQVVAVVTPGRDYELQVEVDPDALLTRLQVFGGEVPRPVGSIEEQSREIRARLSSYLHHSTLMFDGVPQTPAITYVAPTEQPNGQNASAVSGPAGIVRLSGAAPAGVTTVQFGTSTTMGSYAFVLKQTREASGTVHWLTAGETSEPLALQVLAPPSVVAIVPEYVWLGFTHILPKGLDHILFVVGLFLLSSTWRALLMQVTAFTVAHSLTLALAMIGLVRVSPSVVEPLIALSIAYVAVENLVSRQVSRRRVAVVFLFGLLHGLGFAGVLSELGLPSGALVTALVSFNVGVETGQLAVVALTWLLVRTWRSEPSTYRRLVVAPASIAIALVGLYWTVERLA